MSFSIGPSGSSSESPDAGAKSRNSQEAEQDILRNGDESQRWQQRRVTQGDTPPTSLPMPPHGSYGYHSAAG